MNVLITGGSETNQKLVNKFLAEIKSRDIVLANKRSALVKFANWLDNLKQKTEN